MALGSLKGCLGWESPTGPKALQDRIQQNLHRAMAEHGGGQWRQVGAHLLDTGELEVKETSTCRHLQVSMGERGSHTGLGDPPGTPAEQAPITNVPQLCTRQGSLWQGHSPQGKVPCQRDGVADRGGDSLIDGEMEEIIPSIWEIIWKLVLLDMHYPGKGKDVHTGLLNSPAKTTGNTGVLGMLKVPKVSYLLGMPRLQGRAAPSSTFGTGLPNEKRDRSNHQRSPPLLSPRASLGYRDQGWLLPWG